MPRSLEVLHATRRVSGLMKSYEKHFAIGTWSKQKQDTWDIETGDLCSGRHQELPIEGCARINLKLQRIFGVSSYL
jgi:hypothetical protein